MKQCPRSGLSNWEDDMQLITEFWVYLQANWYGLLITGSVLITAAEFVTRLTPTKKDDSAIERIGKAYGKLFDLLKVPNIKRKDGTIVIPEGTHAPRKSDG